MPQQCFCQPDAQNAHRQRRCTCNGGALGSRLNVRPRLASTIPQLAAHAALRPKVLPTARTTRPLAILRAACQRGLSVASAQHRCKCTTVIRMRALACEEPPAQAHGAGKRQASEIGGGTNVLSVFCATFSQSVPERSLRTVSTFWYSISPCLCRTML